MTVTKYFSLLFSLSSPTSLRPGARNPRQAIEAKYRSPVPQPWDSVKLWRVGPGLATLMNMSCVAFMCHYNGVKYYEELRHRTVKKYAVTIG